MSCTLEMQTRYKTEVKNVFVMDPDNKSDKQVTQVVPITDLQSTVTCMSKGYMQIVQKVMSKGREKDGLLSNMGRLSQM